MELREQYDRIYQYLYFRLRDRQAAEDLTQEAFLRFLTSRTYRDENKQLQYLYTIARNLCNQYYRDRTFTYSLDEERDHPMTSRRMDSSESGMAGDTLPGLHSALPAESFEQSLLQQICLREALQKLAPDEREMLFLRYVNDVPVPVMSRLYSISRFAMYRKLKSILKKMRSEMEKEGRNG